MEIQQILNLGVGAFGMYLMYLLYKANLEKMAKSIDHNTEAQKEVLLFMKRLNGKLQGAVAAKIVENAQKEK